MLSDHEGLELLPQVLNFLLFVHIVLNFIRLGKNFIYLEELGSIFSYFGFQLHNLKLRVGRIIESLITWERLLLLLSRVAAV